MSSEFEKEREIILSWVEHAISKILLSEDRTSKHKPFTWREEDEDEHLNKTIRHIITYQLIRDGHQKEDGENHLDNAITRLSMAVAKYPEKCKSKPEHKEGKWYWVQTTKYDSQKIPMQYFKEYGFYTHGTCYLDPYKVKEIPEGEK